MLVVSTADVESETTEDGEKKMCRSVEQIKKVKNIYEGEGSFSQHLWHLRLSLSDAFVIIEVICIETHFADPKTKFC